jgi:hypothetical protein
MSAVGPSVATENTRRAALVQFFRYLVAQLPSRNQENGNENDRSRGSDQSRLCQGAKLLAAVFQRRPNSKGPPLWRRQCFGRPNGSMR